MSKTKDEVKKHAAEILGLKTVGQAIAQPWGPKLNEFWDAAYAMVKRENLNTFSSSGPIQDELYHHFAILMADMGKISVSVPEERYARISRDQPQSWREFRKFAVDRFDSTDGPVDY